MSVHVSSWAWHQSLPSTPKLVLLAFADTAHHDGECWPRVRTVCEQTGLGIRAVQQGIRFLQSRGVLSVIPRTREDGSPGPNLYRILMPSHPPAPGAPPPALDAGPSRTTCTTLPHDVHHPQASGEPSLEPLKTTPPTPPGGGTTSSPDRSNGKESPEELLALWNAYASQSQGNGLPGMRCAIDLTADRRKRAALRLKEGDLEWHEQAIARLSRSGFARGGSPPAKEGQRPWRASFDWYVRNETIPVRCAEGVYDD